MKSTVAGLKSLCVYQASVTKVIAQNATVYNRNILIGGKMIAPAHSSIKQTKISHLGQLMKKGIMKSKEEVEMEYNCNLASLVKSSI